MKNIDKIKQILERLGLKIPESEIDSKQRLKDWIRTTDEVDLYKLADAVAWHPKEDPQW